MNNLIENTMKNLKKNNMDCFFYEDLGDLYSFVDQFIKDNDCVSVGGSQTLFEIGMIDYLRKRKTKFLDRYQEGLTSEDLKNVFRKTFFADIYITSSNAITEDGMLYNVDGRGNRVAAMIYGPDKVLVIAGVNKIVKNIEEAIKRVEDIAAPLNAKRLQIDTPCINTQQCVHCQNKEKICREYVVIKNPLPNRITVLLINEKLGY